MEFGLDQLRTRFEQVRAISTCRDSSNLVADRFEAKYHYAIWSQTGSEAGRRPVADLLARASSLLVIGQIPACCRSATSFGPVCDQDSVMEFGLYTFHAHCLVTLVHNKLITTIQIYYLRQGEYAIVVVIPPDGSV